jgi:hypothetical protein
MAEPLANGHDKSADEDALPWEPLEAAQAAIKLRSQIAAIEITTARNVERATIEALCQDAMRRYVEAMQKGDYQKVVEATREIMRLEIYLSRKGFI